MYYDKHMYCHLTSNETFKAVCKLNIIERHYEQNPCCLCSFCTISAIDVRTVLYVYVQCDICVYSLFVCVQCYLCVCSDFLCLQNYLIVYILNNSV